MTSLTHQVKQGMLDYLEAQMAQIPARREMNGQEFATMLAAAMLSGITLTTDFLTANDGSETVTAQAIGKAANDVAELMGFGKTRLKDMSKSTPQPPAG